MVLAATLVATGAVLGAAGGSGASAPSKAKSGSKAPIVVGAISSISGGSVFGDANNGAAALFRSVNAHGGIDGRKISYSAMDDGINPATAGQDARTFISNGAVALVGGESLLECGVNAATYAAAGIIDSPDGIDSGCFSASNVMPIDFGPFVDLDLNLLYALHVLHEKRLCVLVPGTPGLPQGYAAAVQKFQQDSGTKLALYDNSMTPTTSDYTPYAIKVKDARCQYAYVATQQTQSVAFVNDLAAQGAHGIQIVFPGPDYTPAFAKVIPATQPGVIADDQFTPYTNTSDPAVRQYLSIERHYGGAVSEGGEGGYAAASLFIDVLKAIKGPITRASVTAQYKRMRNVSIPLLGTTWSFGHHVPTTQFSDHFIRVANHVWHPLTTPAGYSVPAAKTA